MPGEHAMLSASGAKKWMSCPPSAKLERKLIDIYGESTSAYAEEGTKAHSLAELKLRKFLGQITDKEYEKARKKLGPIDAEMENATEFYVGYVEEAYMAAKKSCPDAQLFIEQRLDFSEWVPQGFGTGDAVILSDTDLRICDLKYGKGVPVSAVENPQARCYGLGAYNIFGCMYEFQTVTNTIIQPRLDSVSEETLTTVELLAWAEGVLKPKAELAFRGEGEFKPGDHCRFCEAKALCRARALEALTVFEKSGLEAPELIDTDEIPRLLKVADTAINWLKAIQEYAMDQALKGEQFHGYKLVYGRTPRRQFTDEKQVKKILRENGVTYKDYLDSSLKTVAQIEKLIGKAKFAELLSNLTFTPEAKLTLVPDSDKREAYSTANLDFADIEN